MAYIRLTEEGSQVYVFMSSDHHCLTCLSCSLTPEGNGEFLARTTAEMITHLERHKEAGQMVPDVAFERLHRDAAQNDLDMQANPLTPSRQVSSPGRWGSSAPMGQGVGHRIKIAPDVRGNRSADSGSRGPKG